MELFKILKYKTPVSLNEIFSFSPKNSKILLLILKVKLDISQQNFTYRVPEIWNDFSKIVFNRCGPEQSGIVIPGSSANSDLSALISFVKRYLLDI